MSGSLLSWRWLAPILLLAGCAGHQGGGLVPPTQTSETLSAARVRGALPPVPGGIPGIVEIAQLPTIPVQVASDLAGNEWIAGLSPAMLVRVNEQTHAVTHFNLPNENSNPYAVALGPNHTGMWFTELKSNTIGYIRLSNHAIHRYSIPTAQAEPYGITAGPDNAMWFTELGSGKIGRINVDNDAISEYPLPAGSEPYQITLGPDGALWFTDYAGRGIGRMTTSHHFTEYGFKSLLFLGGITNASDGGLWFTGSSSNYPELIGRIDPYTHGRKVWLYGGNARMPRFIVSRDSELWFTEEADAAIGRFNIMTHALHRYVLPGGYVTPLGIARGSDDQIWFTEQDASPQDPAIGKLCPNLDATQCASSP